MSSNITKAFAESKHSLLIPYIPIAWPTADATVANLQNLEKAGADIIELGIPFSDPSADGPVIQRASEEAIANGANLHKTFTIVKEYRELGGKLPIVLMGYANPFLQFGIDELIKQCLAVTVDGILATDWPTSVNDGLTDKLPDAIDRIVLLSPTTSKDRIAEIAKYATGYTYYVSLQGVTGSKKLNTDEVTNHAKMIKEITKLPVAVGFGIRTPEDCKVLANSFDGIIVGTKIIEVINENKSNYHDKLHELISSMKEAIIK